MSRIHPTAIIESGAVIGAEVELGPYCVIGPEVQLGDGCRLESSVRIDGRTEVGPGCRFSHGAAIGGPPQDLKYRGARSRTIIGARSTFRECSTVNRATGEGEATIVGEECLIMAYAHIAHNCVVGRNVILGNGSPLAGHIEVGDYAIISGLTPVHQFVRIGAHVIIGGGLRVPKDVPPFVRAGGMPLRVAGLNSIGLERRGFPPETVAELRKLYRIFFRSQLVKEAALERIRAECRPIPEVAQFLDFIDRSERGLTR